MKNAVILGVIVGATLAIGALRVLNEVYDPSDFHDAYYINQFQVDTFMRIGWTMFYAPFAAGICVLIWTKYEVNYIHILQIEYKNRLNFVQLWKVAFFWAFTTLTANYLFMLDLGKLYKTEKYRDDTSKTFLNAMG